MTTPSSPFGYPVPASPSATGGGFLGAAGAATQPFTGYTSSPFGAGGFNGGSNDAFGMPQQNTGASTQGWSFNDPGTIPGWFPGENMSPFTAMKNDSTLIPGIGYIPNSRLQTNANGSWIGAPDSSIPATNSTASAAVQAAAAAQAASNYSNSVQVDSDPYRNTAPNASAVAPPRLGMQAGGRPQLAPGRPPRIVQNKGPKLGAMLQQGY